MLSPSYKPLFIRFSSTVPVAVRYLKKMNKSLDIKSSTGDKTLVSANYTKLSENIRRYTPQGIQCSVFCGGINCKYENPENWTADSLALQGIYSHWYDLFLNPIYKQYFV